MPLLPSMKSFASTRPPTSAELNYDFTALWNLINGHVDATNAPTLLSKAAGGDIQAALRIIGQGIVIGHADSPAGVAGKLLIDHASAIIELAARAGATDVGYYWSKTAASPSWGLVLSAASGLLTLAPMAGAIAGTDFSVDAPIIHGAAGQVKKTESHYLGTVNDAASHDIFIRIPNDAKRTGGEFKLRASLVPSGVDAAADVDFRFDFVKDGDTINMGAMTLLSWNDISAAANVMRVTNWLALTSLPAAGDQYLAVRFENNCGTAVNYGHVTLEMQYKVDRLGLNADAT